MSVSPIIDKVQKLLALSKGSANANEAAVAAGLANRLIDQYRLSTADLEFDVEGDLEPIEEDPDYIYESGKVTAWKQSLVSVLVSHYGCAYFNDTSYATGRKVTRFRVVGKRSDIGITKYMFAWLTAECSRLADSEAKGRGRIFIASYCQGFVNGVATQLKASRAEVARDVTSSALIKIDAREAASRDAMYKLHSNLRKSNSTSQARMDASAFYMGQKQGSNLHLGASIGSGGTKLLSK